MDCVNIVKMNMKELRKAVKAKHPKARVSTMNKLQLSSMLLGITPTIPPPVKKPKIPSPLRTPALPPTNTTSFKKALTSVRKSRTLKELKEKVKKKPKIPPALKPPRLPPTNTVSFKKALTSVRKSRTLNELKEKAPKYIQEKTRQANIRKTAPINKANIKKGLSNLKKNK